jgi:hypothetical protein
MAATKAVTDRVRRTVHSIFLLIALPLCDVAMAQSYIPSTRWIFMSSPLSPESYEECKALSGQFSEEIRELNAQHDACLQGAPQEPPGSAGCSKASCQALHTARDRASKKSIEETSLCQRRVSEHLQEVRAEEQRRRDVEAEAQRQQREREQAEVTARAELTRADAAAKRKEDQLHREQATRDAHDKIAREEQVRRQQLERENGAQLERDRREQLEQENRAQLEREDQEQWDRYMAFIRKRSAEAYDKHKGPLDAARAAAGQVKDGKEMYEDSRGLIENPFEEAGKKLGASVGDAALAAGINSAFPLGPDRKDETYELAAKAVDKARSEGLEANPFANEVSGRAFKGITAVHEKLLGELDKMSDQVSQITAVQSQPGVQSSKPYQASPSQRFAAADSSSSAAPEVGRQHSRADDARLQGESDSGAVTRPPHSTSNTVRQISSGDSHENPFEQAQGSAPTAGRSDSIHDAGSIPSNVTPGYTLYRDPTTKKLEVVAHQAGLAQGDTSTACSKSGLGIVLSKCERERARSTDPEKAE